MFFRKVFKWYLALQAILYLFFALTGAAGVNWYKLTHKGEAFRMYIALKPGDVVFTEKYHGLPYPMTGHAMVEVTYTQFAGATYSNWEAGKVDDADYSKVCMRLPSSPLDAAAYAANNGCMWVRDRGGIYTYLVGIKEVRPEWERISGLLSDAKQSEYALAWQKVQEKEMVDLLLPQPLWLTFGPTLMLGTILVLKATLSFLGRNRNNSTGPRQPLHQATASR